MCCLGWSQGLPQASSAISYTTHWLGFPHGSAEQTTDLVVMSSSEVLGDSIAVLSLAGLQTLRFSVVWGTGVALSTTA